MMNGDFASRERQTRAVDGEVVRESGDQQSDLVCIFRAGEESLVAIVKSILDGEGIHYIARGADLQDLFGVGRIGSGFNLIVGTVDFFVHKDDAERAREALSAFKEGFMGDDRERQDQGGFRDDS